MRGPVPSVVLLGVSAVLGGCPRAPLRPRGVDQAVARDVVPVRVREEPEDAAALAVRLWRSALSGGCEPTPEARRRIAEELVPLLCARLSHADARVRRRAADALRWMGLLADRLRAEAPAVDVDAVLRALSDPELAHVVPVLRLVEALPARAVRPLEARTDVGDVDAAQVLAEAGPDARRGLLLRTAGPEPGAYAASLALARVPLDAREVATLLDGAELATEPTSGRRWNALDASLDPTFPAWDRVVACLDAPALHVRRAAAYALRKRGRDPDLARKLHALALREREPVYAEALERLGPLADMAPSLADVVRDPTATPEFRAACLRALGRLGRGARGYLALVRSRVYEADDRREVHAARDARDWIEHGAPPR